jgi:hypothetical protein
MKVNQKAMLGTLLFFIMVFSISANVQAAKVPDWIPDEKDISGYNLMFSNATSVENFVCQDAENMTIYSQLWYKNNSAGNTTAFIAQGFIDMGKDYFGESFSAQEKLMLSAMGFRNVNTKWDFFVQVMNMTGIANEIKIEGWDRAIEYNLTGSWFQYMIFGTIGSKVVISFALEIDQDYWWGLSQEDLGLILTIVITSFVSMVAAFSSIGATCPSSASIQPAAGSTYTPKEELIAFNSLIGKALAEKKIDGFSVILVLCVSVSSAMFLIKKRYSQ